MKAFELHGKGTFDQKVFKLLCDRVEGEGSSDLAVCYREGEKPFFMHHTNKIAEGRICGG